MLNVIVNCICDCKWMMIHDDIWWSMVIDDCQRQPMDQAIQNMQNMQEVRICKRILIAERFGHENLLWLVHWNEYLFWKSSWRSGDFKWKKVIMKHQYLNVHGHASFSNHKGFHSLNQPDGLSESHWASSHKSVESFTDKQTYSCVGSSIKWQSL